jgi:hypothetical protein
MLNSLDYQNTKFARQSGQSWLRPDYANAIEHYRPTESAFHRYYHLFSLMVFATLAVGVVFGGFVMLTDLFGA